MARQNGVSSEAHDEEMVLTDAHLKTWRPQPAKYDKDGNEVEAPSFDLVFRVSMDQVGGRVSRLAWLFRHDVAIELTVTAPEQLSFADAVHEAARAHMRPLEGIETTISTPDGRRTVVPPA